MLKVLIFTFLIVYMVYSLPLDDGKPNEKPPTDNDKSTKLIQPQDLLKQGLQKIENPQNERTKRETNDGSPKKDGKNERKTRNTGDHLPAPETNQKPSERKTRDAPGTDNKHTDTKPHASSGNQSKTVGRLARHTSDKDENDSKTSKQPSKPVARRDTSDDNVLNQKKHVDEDKNAPPKPHVIWAADKSKEDPKPKPENNKKN